MKIHRIHLRSFRGFGELDLDLDRPITALVGINGAGKTSVLEAIALALSQLSAAVGMSSRPRQLKMLDIHVGQPAATIELEVSLGDLRLRLRQDIDRRSRFPRLSTSIGTLEEVGRRLANAVATSAMQPPLAVYYPVSRAVTRQAGEEPAPVLDRLAAGAGALFGSTRNFHRFFEWFRAQEDLENEQKARGRSEASDPQLAAVRRAIYSLVPAFSELRIERTRGRRAGSMVVTKAGEVLEIDQLSHGEQSLLAMTGDLAFRLAIANPEEYDPLGCEVVVLIDELELHLHPGWQRAVVRALQGTFPRAQFVLASHSPQVLSELPPRSVVFLEAFKSVEPPVPIHGRDSNAILAEAMQVPERPQAILDELHRVSRLIDEQRSDEARDAIGVLAREIGEHDSELVRLRSLLKFLDPES
jgi:predicted ATP-binding protein involved in virulence